MLVHGGRGWTADRQLFPWAYEGIFAVESDHDKDRKGKLMFWLVIRNGNHEIIETVGGRPPQDDGIVVLAGSSVRAEAEVKMKKAQDPTRPRWE